mgnify:CR=1 FL=1
MAGIMSTGYRKTCVARVTMKAGDGKILVNNKNVEEYFPSKLHRIRITEPLHTVNKDKQFNLEIQVFGGGLSGQADAICHAVAKALSDMDNELRPALREKGFLTRDSRIKERVKAGLRGARKDRQYRKR